MYVPCSVMSSGAPDERLSVIGGMFNDRTGLWEITDERVGLLKKYLDAFSKRSRPAVEEMLVAANNGDRFWPTKAEYFAAISEIKTKSTLVSKEQIDEVVLGMVKGSRVDNVSDREWVKRAIEILRRVSSDK